MAAPTPSLPATKPRRPWHWLSIRRVRTATCIAGVALFVAMGISSRRDVLAFYNGTGNANYMVALTAGKFIAFWATDDQFDVHVGRQLPAGFSTAVEKPWEDSISLAWRPYHIGARPGLNPGDTHHGLAVPLWLLALPCSLLAAYTHGLLVGFRRGDKSRCVRCGYSRSGLTADAPCPECGAKAAAHLAPKDG